MTKTFTLSVAALLYVHHLATLNGAQDTQIAVRLSELRSSEWSDRARGFYAIVRDGRVGAHTEFPVADGVGSIANSSVEARSELVKGLDALLKTETALVNSEKAPDSHEYSSYYGDVIQAVTTLRDPSSISVLLDCVNTGGMAVRALAAMGDDALTAALERLPNADPETRHSLFRLFAEMADTGNRSHFRTADPTSKLLNVLLQGANDSDPFSRSAVVPGLAHLNSPEAAKALDRLAQSDPFSTSAENGVRFPVREAALRALKRAGVAGK